MSESANSSLRPEDIFEEVLKIISPNCFRQFARSKDGLCLDSIVIDNIWYSNDQIHEKKIKLLQEWHMRNKRDPSAALRLAWNFHTESGYIVLEKNILMFYKEKIANHPFIFSGSQYMGDLQNKLAIKLFPSDLMNDEIKILCQLPFHQNVISCVSQDSIKFGKLNFHYLAMELCDENSLYTQIIQRKHNNPLSLTDKYSFARQLFSGLQHIHSNRICHCDLKPHNILLSINGKCLKITDFSTSRRIDDMHPSSDLHMVRPGTDGYRAPEIYSNKIPDFKSDVYSAGIVIAFLWSDGEHPFGEDPDDWNKNMKKNQNCNLGILKLSMQLDKARKFLESLLQFEPSERPTAEKIVDNWQFHVMYSSDDNAGTIPVSHATRPKELFQSKLVQRKLKILIFARSQRCLYSFDPSVEQGERFKNEQSLMDLMVSETFSSVVVGNSIFILTWIGYIYKMTITEQDNGWEKVAETNRIHGRYPAAAVIGDRIYICGGGWEEGGYCQLRKLPLLYATEDCEVYDVIKKEMREIRKMQQARRHHMVVAANDCIFAFGGQRAGGEVLKSMEKYNPQQDTWSELTAVMNEARCRAAATVFQKKIWVFGGKNENESISSVEHYDFEVEAWTKFKNNMNIRRRLFRVCVLGSELFAVGGDGSGFTKFPAGRSIEKLDMSDQTADNEWKEVTTIDGVLEGCATVVVEM